MFTDLKLEMYSFNFLLAISKDFKMIVTWPNFDAYIPSSATLVDDTLITSCHAIFASTSEHAT